MVICKPVFCRISFFFFFFLKLSVSQANPFHLFMSYNKGRKLNQTKTPQNKAEYASSLNLSITGKTGLLRSFTKVDYKVPSFKIHTIYFTSEEPACSAAVPGKEKALSSKHTGSSHHRLLYISTHHCNGNKGPNIIFQKMCMTYTLCFFSLCSSSVISEDMSATMKVNTETYKPMSRHSTMFNKYKNFLSCISSSNLFSNVFKSL